MSFFKKDELRLLWPFYLEAIFVNLIYLYPIFYVLYMKDIGLSLTQIGFLTSAYCLANLIFEIPTGAIADIFGRKLSTILGYFLTGLSMLFVMFFTNYYILLGLFFVRGAVETLRSGAEEAWIVDLLKHKKRKNLIHDFYQKNHSFISLGAVLAGIVGAFFVKQFGLGIIWPITAGSLILTSFIFIFGKEHFIKRKQKTYQAIKEVYLHSKKSVKYSLIHPVMFLLLLTGMITVFVSVVAGDITWYPFLQNLGFKEYWFGYLASAGCLFGIFIPYITKKLCRKVGGYKKYLTFFLILESILLISVFFLNKMFFAIAIYLLFLAVPDFYSPVRCTFFQHFLSSKIRATISSFRNMLFSISALIAAPLAGFVADKIGPQKTIALAGILLIPAIILYLKIPNNKVPKSK